jgi:hypothetical protein
VGVYPEAMFETTSVTDIELYEALKPKIGEKEARSLIAFVEFKSEKKFEEKKDTLTTKEDIRRLEGICSGLEVKIESVRSDILRWMFLFWMGQFAALIAVLQIFFKP